VTFNRAQSQYLDAGPRTLNIATNGGLTIVAVVRFTGTPLWLERIIELGQGADDAYKIMVYRCCLNEGDDPSKLELIIVQPGGWIVMKFPGVIEQNSWATVVLSHSASTSKIRLTVNSITTVGEPYSVLGRTVTNTEIGRGFWSGYQGGGVVRNSNFDVAGVFVVDEYLGTGTTSAIVDSMVRGEDLTTQGPCAPQVPSPLLPVALS
jgi:hypothetical protein